MHVLWLGYWWYTWACCLYLSLPNHVYNWEIFKSFVLILSCTCQWPQSITDVVSLLIFSELWWLACFESDFLTQVSPAASRECGKTRKTSKAPGLPEAIPSGSFTVGQSKAWSHLWAILLWMHMDPIWWSLFPYSSSQLNPCACLSFTHRPTFYFLPTLAVLGNRTHGLAMVSTMVQLSYTGKLCVCCHPTVNHRNKH